ncbi:MAG: TSUP family transporter [Nocardioides sp.]|uniref:TSUP family transporter n=1 Tax=Nocardioides sp. TaxID=35761 RepID=UPI003EFDF14A
MSLLVAVAAGALIGLSLGALGGGGSILAVPVLVHLLGQSPAQATTGSLVVVAATSLIGAVGARRTVMLSRGLAFSAVAVGGALVGAHASTRVGDDVLLAAFSVLMLGIGALMAVRQVRRARAAATGTPEPYPQIDDPIITFHPTFACDCPQALKVLVTATAVGLLTGFLGVGGGFLVVPALLLALHLPLRQATSTSLVVITVTSLVALAGRAGSGVAPDWGVVAVLTVASCAAALVGTALARRTDTSRLSGAFTVLVLVVAGTTASQALPALV